LICIYPHLFAFFFYFGEEFFILYKQREAFRNRLSENKEVVYRSRRG